MNATTYDTPNLTTGDENILGNEYLTISLGLLLIISEVLPLLKNKSNGLVHTAICLLRGSSCLTKKVADTLEATIDKENSNNV